MLHSNVTEKYAKLRTTNEAELTVAFALHGHVSTTACLDEVFHESRPSSGRFLLWFMHCLVVPTHPKEICHWVPLIFANRHEHYIKTQFANWSPYPAYCWANSTCWILLLCQLPSGFGYAIWNHQPHVGTFSTCLAQRICNVTYVICMLINLVVYIPVFKPTCHSSIWVTASSILIPWTFWPHPWEAQGMLETRHRYLGWLFIQYGNRLWMAVTTATSWSSCKICKSFHFLMWHTSSPRHSQHTCPKGRVASAQSALPMPMRPPLRPPPTLRRVKPPAPNAIKSAYTSYIIVIQCRRCKCTSTSRCIQQNLTSISPPNAEEVHLGLHARADVDLIIYDYEPLEAGVLSWMHILVKQTSQDPNPGSSQAQALAFLNVFAMFGTALVSSDRF